VEAEALHVAEEGVFQHKAPPGERAASNLLLDRLIDGDIGLIADEVDHVGLPGMQQLRHLWDRAAGQGGSFPLLIVGCGVYQTLENADEVRSRVARWVSFDRVDDPADAAIIAAALHPRLAASNPPVIERINERVAGFSIRSWEQFAEHIDYLSSTDPAAKKPKGLTGDDVRQIRTMMGRGLAA
jgi:hypothetical protein